MLSAGLAAIGHKLEYLLPGPEPLIQVINFLVSFGVITVLFAMIYKMLPDVSIQWSDVWIGAGMTSLLFTIGKFLIGLYLGKSDVGVVYGAAGSLIVILSVGLLCRSDIPARRRVYGCLCEFPRFPIGNEQKCDAGIEGGGVPIHPGGRSTGVRWGQDLPGL